MENSPRVCSEQPTLWFCEGLGRENASREHSEQPTSCDVDQQ